MSNSCIVCGRCQEHSGLKPVPCDSKACNHDFDENGIGADFGMIYTKPVVADLLISMASAACQCTSRRDSIFRVLPSEFVINQGHWKLSSTLARRLIGIVCSKHFWAFHLYLQWPTRTVCKNHFIGTLIMKDRTTKLRLLRSVLNSCRGHLMQLEGGDKFTRMETNYQFRLCADSRSKEAEFAQLKEKHGSQFLFHGSPFYNWHCILREGLKNLSGSELMSHAASHGPGIYLSEHSHVSAEFCGYFDSGRTTSTYYNSIFGTNPLCIALCEVISDSFSTTATSRGVVGNISNIRVVPDAKNVITRYIFVYPSVYPINPTSEIPTLHRSELTDQCQAHANDYQ